MSSNEKRLGASSSEKKSPKSGAPSPVDLLVSAESVKVDAEAKARAAAKEVAVELCVDALMAGCVLSFTEFFTLSHREPVCVDPLANKMFSIPADKLKEIQATLVQAERARREGSFREVYEGYIKLANYFEDEHDFDTMLHFQQLGLDVSKQSIDKDLEGLAHENFGNAHERLGNLEMAIQFHETHLRIAEASRIAAMKKQANRNLIRVYMKRAAECEKFGNYVEAKELYSKTLDTARLNCDTEAEGEAYHKLGQITVLLGDMEKAVEYQKRFLMVSKEVRNEAHEGKANVSLAELQEVLGQVHEATLSLQRSLEIAEQKGDDDAICEACTKLGMLHNKQGNYLKAMQCLEQNYRVARRKGDRASVEKARILLGVASGNYAWSSGFVEMADRNLEGMLKWKCQGALPGMG